MSSGADAQVSIEYDASRDALNHPERRPTVFGEGTTLTLSGLAVEAARLAYLRAESDAGESRRLGEALQLAGFGAPATFFDLATGAYAYASLRPGDGLAMLAFRGAQPDEPKSVMADLASVPAPWAGGQVHAGFCRAAESLETQVLKWLANGASHRRRLLLCGHSLGAAMATIFAALVEPTHVITIGSPRVGDMDFVGSLPAQAMTRIVNCADIVPTLPPRITPYHHVGHLLYIDRDGLRHENPDTPFVLRDRIAGQAGYAARLVAEPGDLPLRSLADHSPVNYLRAFI
ncbi:lipase family protein [Variovorax saccharolyticus]|uniref:lipase family protein n=1 Tax=Variovorax saccharolyticus TaxID=3053516 RepID=UPI002575E88E|nr:lipase family protein [Variovorax sp. J22R187]MDM0017339.1 lipase family protein [Variovorax sp. J22R187]